MQTVKIVIVGAGSGSFGRAAIADVLACTELNEKTELKLVLVDVEQAALDRMYHFSEVLKEYRQVPTQIEATINHRQAFCAHLCRKRPNQALGTGFLYATDLRVPTYLRGKWWSWSCFLYFT